MKIVLFYHSLLSDWNHGNAHFLRGVAWELRRRGHDVRVLEPAGGWSLSRLLEECGTGPIDEFNRRYPGLKSEFYDPHAFDPAPASSTAAVYPTSACPRSSRATA
jgi:hypothetical protein